MGITRPAPPCHPHDFKQPNTHRPTHHNHHHNNRHRTRRCPCCNHTTRRYLHDPPHHSSYGGLLQRQDATPRRLRHTRHRLPTKTTTTRSSPPRPRDPITTIPRRRDAPHRRDTFATQAPAHAWPSAPLCNTGEATPERHDRARTSADVAERRCTRRRQAFGWHREKCVDYILIDHGSTPRMRYRVYNYRLALPSDHTMMGTHIDLSDTKCHLKPQIATRDADPLGGHSRRGLHTTSYATSTLQAARPRQVRRSTK